MEEGIHVAISAEKLGEFFGIPITNTLVTSRVVIALLSSSHSSYRSACGWSPSKFQTLLEEMFSYVYSYVAETLESRDMARQICSAPSDHLPLSLRGQHDHFVPGIGSIEYHGEAAPCGRPPPTSSFLWRSRSFRSFVVEVLGIVGLGLVKYGGKFIVNPLRDPMGLRSGW